MFLCQANYLLLCILRIKHSLCRLENKQLYIRMAHQKDSSYAIVENNQAVGGSDVACSG